MVDFPSLFSDIPRTVVVITFLLLSLVALLKKAVRLPFPPESYVLYLWVFFLVFTVREILSFQFAIWILAFLCFVALKEYFTLIDIRLQDRWGIVGAYLSIPFMIYFIQIDWYGMFIISIPVYAFLVIPFLVTLGGKETEGTVFSIGAIDFGLFLLVYCIGHIGYLSHVSTWMAILLVLNVALCDLSAFLLQRREKRSSSGPVAHFLVSAPATVLLTWTLSGWTGIPWNHCVGLGLLIPVSVAVGRHTIGYVESDLRIGRDMLLPGKGQILDNIKSFLYAAPVVFHYSRYFLG